MTNQGSADEEEGAMGDPDELRARAEADVTRIEREHLLAQMRQANERLVIATLRADDLAEQAIAARRTAEELAGQLRTSEEALRASEAEAQANNRAKDEFLAMLGHELRNPLSPILIALDLIAMAPPDPHERAHTMIARQVKHVVRLVDDLLDVSRINNGKIALQREHLELAPIVSRAIETASPWIESKHHTLHVAVPDHGLAVDGDAVRLTQVIGNLITNAAKYTPPGGSITVIGERRATTVVLRIRDTGIGIAKEMLPRIFELFEQERPTLDRSPGGLGIGLTIARSLIAMHGGTVTAHSEGRDRGSEFVIELPAIAAGDVAATDRPHDSAVVPASKVLVVDDNRDLADATATALARLGHEVRVAFDGPSALAMAAELAPDVVLLDLGLPGLDGYEVARRLRAMLPAHHLQLVAVTGYGQAVDRQRSHAAGFDSHLVKPVDVATLQRAIGKFHDRCRD